MKKLILPAILFVFVNSVIAQQVPQALNYQAVARTANGLIIPNQNVSVRFSILDGSISGPVVYQETHTTSTNNYGLFTLAIGRGTVVSGTFAAISWGISDKFLRVEIAADGTTNYQVQGTTQFLSVPYSLFSERTRLFAGNNTITITNGNTITGNYQPANNTITINGNAISGNYQAANNTILVNGNTIAGNYQAGTGINISGNTISSTTNNLWVPDANGIHNFSGNVGIGQNSSTTTRFVVRQPNSGGIGYGIATFETNDTWQAALVLRNDSQEPFRHTTTLSIGGINNTAQKPGNFGIYNNYFPTGAWLMNCDNVRNYVAFGNDLETAVVPRSRVHVINGDVNIEQIGSGIILKSPNGSCWRVTIDNAGNLVRTAITCP